MATRYWVGGSGSWSKADLHWAESSGGAPNAALLPTSTDDVVFDENSNAGTAAFTVDVDGIANCENFSTSNLDGSMTFQMNATSELSCHGSMTLPSTNFTWAGGSTVIFKAITTGKTVTTNGVTVGSRFEFNGVGGGWTLGSAFTTSLASALAINILNGTFDTGNYNVTCSGGGFTIGAGTKTVNLGSSTISTNISSGGWTATATGTTLNAGTSTISIGFSSATFAGGGLTYNNVTFSGGAGTKTVNGANTFNGQFLVSNAAATNLTFTANQNFTGGALIQATSPTVTGAGFSYTGTVTFTSAAHGTKTFGSSQTFQNLTITCPAVDGITILSIGPITVTGTLTTTDGGSTARRVQIVGATSTQRLLTVGTNSLVNTDFGFINAAGTASWTFGLGYGDLGNNAGITFNNSTLYWIGGTGNWSDTTKWSTSSGGSAANAVPAPQNSVIFDANSNTLLLAFTVTGNAAMQCNDFSTGGAGGALDGAMTLTLGATARLDVYGSMTLPASNFAFSNTSGSALNFRATTTGKTFTTNGVSVPTVAINFNGTGGEWTLGSALTSGNINVFEGSLVSGNFNITYGSLITSGSLARSISLGSSTLTGSGSSPVSYTGSNLTWNAGTSTINCSNASPTLAGAGLTFHNVSFTSTAIGTVTLTGANTYNNLTFAARAAAGSGTVSVGDNQTVSGTLTLGSGTTGVARLLVASSVIGTPRTLTVATLAAPTDVDFRDIVAAGASAPWSGTRLGNCLGNSNITFDAAKTVYWNLAAGGNFNAAAWATTSGGTAATTNFPLAQDTAIIENTGLNTSATITAVASHVGTINMSTRSNAMTLASTGSIIRIYGNLVFSSAVTNTATSGGFSFNGQGVTQQLTTAGITIAGFVTQENLTGTLQLQDNCTLASTATTTLTSGTLDLSSGNRTLTTGLFSSSNSNTRSILFGTGEINVTGNNGTVLAMTTLSNFTYTGTSKINFTYSGGIGTRTIATGVAAGGVTELTALNINITAGTDILSIGAVFKNLDFTGFSGAIQAPTSSRVMYGNLKFSSGMTIPSMTFSYQFSATSGTQQITSAGQTLDFPITQDGVGGTVQLQDNLTMGSTRAFTLTAGTLDLNDFNLVAGSISSSNSNTRSIDFGRNSVINCENNFGATTGTGLTTTGRGRIKMTSTFTKTFAGGGANYSAAALEQAGEGTLLITGANTFGDITNSHTTPVQVTFPASTTTFVRKLSLSGSTGKLVSMRSSTPGSAYTIQTV
jgi:hypothetical protein